MLLNIWSNGSVLAQYQSGAQMLQNQLSISEEPRDPPVRIHATARSYGDSIVLRWAPNDAAAWIQTNHFGYQIIKRYVTPDSAYVSELLTPEPLMPWSLELMMEHFTPDDTIAAVAAEVIHGDGFAALYIDDEQDGFVENLIQQTELQNTRFAFAMQAAELNPKVADAMALRFTDTDVEKGMIYSYLIQATTPENMMDIQSGMVILRCEPPDTLWPPAEIDIRQADINRVELAWSRDEYSAYYVERSTDGGQTFRRVNSNPYYSTMPDPEWETYSPLVEFYSGVLQHYHVFSDTITPGITYHYRVQGINAFSDLSLFTDTVRVTPIDLKPIEVPMITSVSTYEDTQVRLRWSMTKEDPDLAGFYVEKADDRDGIWTTINDIQLPASAREYIDTGAYETNGGFYRIVSIGHSGKNSRSLSVRGLVEDMDPPSVPEGLTGIVYADGIVELFWDHSPEDDVLGYRVAYANQADHEFTVITPRAVSENYYQDTIPLETLSRQIYYKVLAEDYSGNFSDFSDVLKLTRPDIVPPVTPLVINAIQDAGNVHIWWSPSPSKDVFVYRIFRKQEDAELWDLVHFLDPDEVEEHIAFTDSPAPSPIPYQYGIEAIDFAGNTSGLSRLLSFRVRGSPVPDIPIELTAEFDEENRQVNLKWSCESPFPYYVILLRSTGESPLVPVTTVDSSTTVFTDRRLSNGTSLSYVIRLQLEDGRQSQPSEPVKVIIP